MRPLGHCTCTLFNWCRSRFIIGRYSNFCYFFCRWSRRPTILVPSRQRGCRPVSHLWSYTLLCRVSFGERHPALRSASVGFTEVSLKFEQELAMPPWSFTLRRDLERLRQTWTNARVFDTLIFGLPRFDGTLRRRWTRYGIPLPPTGPRTLADA